jgi:DNA adenine methylase
VQDLPQWYSALSIQAIAGRSNFVDSLLPSCSMDPSLAPFLKWAGGKRWLLPLAQRLARTPVKRYFEPFVGSGAMFFAIRPAHSVLSDLNRELVETYQAIQEDWAAVSNALVKHHKAHSFEYYYRMRAAAPRTAHTKAARFIYLNRTCWNGLYRVNRAGMFNTPIGTKTNVILKTDDFEAVAQSLVDTRLLVSDFESVVDQAGRGDLVFADPPYTVRHQFNGFIKYNEKLFSWADQERLMAALARAKERGAKIVCTNADHKSVRDLYAKEFSLTPVNRYSAISGSSASRGRYAELVIMG